MLRTSTYRQQRIAAKGHGRSPYGNLRLGYKAKALSHAHLEAESLAEYFKEKNLTYNFERYDSLFPGLEWIFTERTAVGQQLPWLSVAN